MTIKIYNLTQQEIDDCAAYASKIDVGHYSKRDNQKIEKTKRLQQFVGKSVEFGGQHYLINTGHQNVSKPDCNVYPVGKKSFAHDLITSKNNIHVKGQSTDAARRYGASWLFENNDTHIFESYQKNDAVMFVTADLYLQYDKVIKVTTEIKAIIPVVKLHQYNSLFQLPQMEY